MNKLYFNKPIYITGDIHGLFCILQNYLEYYSINNIVLIVAGDCGMMEDCTKHKYTIHIHCDDYVFWQDVSHYRWLSFPTQEMRDAFFENFKDLIEACKELL